MNVNASANAANFNEAAYQPGFEELIDSISSRVKKQNELPREVGTTTDDVVLIADGDVEDSARRCDRRRVKTACGAVAVSSNVRLPRRNPYLNEAIEHFDQYIVQAKMDSKKAWALLTPKEYDFLSEEVAHCITDARYYLENYHVVMTEQEGLKTLYPLWDSQEIFYETIVAIQADGRPVKLVVLKARQLGLDSLGRADLPQDGFH